MSVEVRRDIGRAFGQSLERVLRADDLLSDRNSVRLFLEKARDEQAQRSRKRFDAAAVFRNRILYDRIDAFLAGWCRGREVKADPYRVFRYEGPERGPTQHETAVGPSWPQIERAFDRLAEQVPELAAGRAGILKAPTKVIAPAFRLQFPLPFGACGEVEYDGERADLARAVHRTALYTATRGDVSRSWAYDCGLLLFYGRQRPKLLLEENLWDQWPDVQQRVWTAARVWTIVL